MNHQHQARSKACSQVCPSSASTRCCCSAQPHTAEQHDGPHIKAMWEWESFIIALCCCLQRCFPSSTAFIPGSWPRPFQRTSEVCLGLFLSLSAKPYQKKKAKTGQINTHIWKMERVNELEKLASWQQSFTWCKSVKIALTKKFLLWLVRKISSSLIPNPGEFGWWYLQGRLTAC